MLIHQTKVKSQVEFGQFTVLIQSNLNSILSKGDKAVCLNFATSLVQSQMESLIFNIFPFHVFAMNNSQFS